MAQKKTFRILLQVTKKVKKVPTNVLEEIAKDLTDVSAAEKIAELKELKQKHFVVENSITKTKIVYILSLSGRNYTTKTTNL